MTRISGQSPDEFGKVIGAAVLNDGSVAVADASHRNVRIFANNGTELAVTGRLGSGPGEFQQIDFVGRCAGDSLYVFDPELSRITVLAANGSVVRTFPISLRNRPVFSVRCNRTGALLLVGWPEFRAEIPLGPYRSSQSLWMADAAGVLQREIGKYAGGERYRYPRGDGPRIFGKVLGTALGDSSVYVGQADSFYIDRVDHMGRHRGAITRQAVPRPVTKTDITAFMEEHLATVSDPGARASQRQGIADYRFPENFPAYSAIVVDPAGLVWVQNYYAPTSQADTWLVFRPNGSFLQEVALPPDSEMLSVGVNHMLMRYTTPQGAHEVHIFRLDRN